MNKEIIKKQIAILGSTGSIGTQALQVIEQHPERYEVYALTALNKVELLIAQARKFQPEAVVIANETKYHQLKDALADLPIKVYAGADALCAVNTLAIDASFMSGSMTLLGRARALHAAR